MNAVPVQKTSNGVRIGARSCHSSSFCTSRLSPVKDCILLSSVSLPHSPRSLPPVALLPVLIGQMQAPFAIKNFTKSKLGCKHQRGYGRPLVEQRKFSKALSQDVPPNRAPQLEDTMPVQMKRSLSTIKFSRLFLLGNVTVRDFQEVNKVNDGS